MYCLKIILLKNCFYSDKIKKILIEDIFNKIKITYIEITDDNKNKYKTNEIKTFPQVYMIRDNMEGKLLIGGCDDMIKVINIIQGKQLNKIKIHLASIYPSWSEKAILRLIELFN